MRRVNARRSGRRPVAPRRGARRRAVASFSVRVARGSVRSNAPRTGTGQQHQRMKEAHMSRIDWQSARSRAWARPRARCRSRARRGHGDRYRRSRRSGADHAARRQFRRAGQPRPASGLRQLGGPDRRRHVHGPDHRGGRRHRDPRRRRELDDLRRRPDLHLHAARPYLVGRHAGHRRRLRVRPAPDPRSRDRGRIRLSALPDQERRGDQQRQPDRSRGARRARGRSRRPSRSRSSGRPPTSSSC